MNPFKYGQIVKGSDFCRRPELEKNLANQIRRGQNVYIQGERRTGKSSLVWETVRRLKKPRIVYIDLLETKTSDDLIRRMVTGVISLERSRGIISKVLQKLAYLRPMASIDPLSGMPTLALDASVQLKPESISGVLDLISDCQLKTKPLVVVFDEFQDILNLKDAAETLAQLRSKLQFQVDIPYLFAGSVRNKMNTIFYDPDSAFFKSAIPIDVGPLNKVEFQTFIADKFKTGKRKITTNAMGRIFDICFNVAGDIQQLCSALWDTTSYGNNIGNKQIPYALEQIFAHESKGYETILQVISGLQLNFLTGMARLGGHAPTSSKFLKQSGISQASSAQSALKRLMDLKVVFKHENRYRFVNPFFRAWLLYKKF
ncbi:MAG: ATP-binding protein [Desulfosarcina sp.]|nr:ATP-binding protein [Desulfosarcina sp.]MBC2767874.1 ATP-binding protein [Desulfosarcina sp.]